jgi:hypothetical protein
MSPHDYRSYDFVSLQKMVWTDEKLWHTLLLFHVQHIKIIFSRNIYNKYIYLNDDFFVTGDDRLFAFIVKLQQFFIHLFYNYIIRPGI